MRGMLLIALVGVVLLPGCSRCSNSGVDANFDIPDSLGTKAPVVREGVLGEMVENISSPVETAALIKRLKVPFDKDLLVPANAASNFNTNFQKALGLGLYGTDLGYLNMYEKTSEVLSYISVVKDLADGIQVGQFFDFSSLKRLATNNESLDSLIVISQQSYNGIDKYLRETNRSSLSIVIVAGVWVEGMYLATRVAQQTKSEQMVETVADQKVVLGTLLPLLRMYEHDSNIKELADKIESLKKLYDRVKITYEKGEPEMQEKDGKITFVQKDKQFIEASPELMGEIMAEIISVRNGMIAKNE